MTDAVLIGQGRSHVAATARSPQLHVLHSASDAPCGVESFARRIVEAAGAGASGAVLAGRTAMDLRGPGSLVINLPIVAWKTTFFSHTLAAMVARLRGLSVVVVLHEWDDLDPKRRATYLGLTALATSVLFSCRSVEQQFARSWRSAFVTRRRGRVPIPPNVRHPGTTLRGRHAEALAADRAAGAIVLGYFGSIYPKKQPLQILEVAADLKRRGRRVSVVFVGSFVRGGDDIERDFAARVADLGLDGDVTVTGYVRSEAELFGIFEEVDVFVYRFAEGLTPRRGSVLACLQSGKPVVVNAPRDRDELDHHAIYGALLGNGSLRLVAPEADTAELADAVLEAREASQDRAAVMDVRGAWAQALAAIETVAYGRAPREPRPA